MRKQPAIELKRELDKLGVALVEETLTTALWRNVTLARSW